jgi:hypothetical protein
VGEIVKKKDTINDNLKPLKRFAQVSMVKWDIHSPRFSKAIDNLGLIHQDLVL